MSRMIQAEGLRARAVFLLIAAEIDFRLDRSLPRARAKTAALYDHPPLQRCPR
jgi:hypothetical protein